MMPSITLEQRLDLATSKANECCAYFAVVLEFDGEVRMKAAAELHRNWTRQECSRISEGGPDGCLVVDVERMQFLVEKGAKNVAHRLGV